MREMILLFQFEDRARKNKLLGALLPLRLKIKEIPQEDYGKPIGYLAGVKEFVEDERDFSGGTQLSQEEVLQEKLSGEMLVMAGLNGDRVDQVLRALHKAGLSIPYKAVLTPSNQSWDAWELFAEVKKEHEAMA